MRQTRRSGNFVLCLLINMVLNAEGLIPAAILLTLHFWLKFSVWWSVLAVGLWLARLTVGMLLIGWASRCGNTPDPVKPNKNPYSKSHTDLQ